MINSQNGQHNHMKKDGQLHG
uniref:Uncharacterized protein n=1 Tax=Anguilla anguilla TaxID=7936 RepID=A0A0E9W2X9_ANGAN